MYRPRSFQVDDPERLMSFIEEHSFATLVSWGPGEPMVSHVPVIVRRDARGEPCLLGHLARANRHWRRFTGTEEALAVFHGPHGYISPRWYAVRPSVPTWNYAVVHVYGRPSATEEPERVQAIVQDLVHQHERTRTDPWDGALPAAFLEKELRGIVGFEMPLERLEGKFKLSQNRAPEDRAGVLAGLRRGGCAEVELAKLMEEYGSSDPADA